MPWLSQQPFSQQHYSLHDCKHSLYWCCFNCHRARPCSWHWGYPRCQWRCDNDRRSFRCRCHIAIVRNIWFTQVSEPILHKFQLDLQWYCMLSTLFHHRIQMLCLDAIPCFHKHQHRLGVQFAQHSSIKFTKYRTIISDDLSNLKLHRVFEVLGHCSCDFLLIAYA